MKKRLADDPKSWGKQEGSGQAAAAPTPEQSGLPKPLMLADIRVGERYVTLRRAHDGQLYARSWKAVAEPVLYAGPWVELQGLMVIDVEIPLSDGTVYESRTCAACDGLESSAKWKDNGHRTFLATPETVALIEGIVERQDHVEYAAIIKEQIPPRDELVSTYWDAPTPPEILGLIGKGILQSLDVAMRTKADAFEPLEPPTKLISLRERRYHLQPPKLVRLDSDEFLREFAKLLKAKG